MWQGVDPSSTSSLHATAGEFHLRVGQFPWSRLRCNLVVSGEYAGNQTLWASLRDVLSHEPQ